MPADGTIVLGLNAVTAENTGSTATPVYAIITNVRDETINTDTALADVTNRAANGWRPQVATLSDLTIDTQMVYKANDTVIEGIRDAFFAKTRVLMGFFDGDPADAAVASEVSGFTGGFGITNFSINRGLEEAMMIDITFQVRDDDAGDGPVWTTYTADPNP